MVVRMREEAAYWLAEARDSFEQGEFMDEQTSLADLVAICERHLYEVHSWDEQKDEALTAAWMQNRLLAQIASAMLKQNHWLEQIAHRLKNIDDNSIVMREK